MSVASSKAKLAGLVAHRPADDPEITDARRDLAAENLAAHIKRIVDDAPPLTDEQLSKLAVLLRSGE